MKKFVFLFSIMLSFIFGSAIAMIAGLPPVAGGAFAAGASLIPNASEGLRAGIYTEVWTGEMVKAFRTSMESIGWLNKIRGYDQYVENDVIHFVNLGGDPGVLINNTTYPIDVETLTDTDKPIGLDKYQTKATQVTDDELYAISYDKMGSVVERHREAINEKKYSKAIHALAPADHDAAHPVILTTGANSEDATRKMIKRDDIIALKKLFDNMKVPTIGRILVLCPDHVNDLLLVDQKFAEQYYNYSTGKIANLYGFEVYEYTECPYYTVATKAKKVFGAAADGADRMASVAFFAPRMMKATGSTTPYLSEARNNPTTQANLANFRHYFICLPLKNEAIGAIVSATGDPLPGTVVVLPEDLEFLAAGESKLIAVTASGPWTAEVTGTGFNIVAEGNAITVTAAANSGALRTGKVTVTLTSDPTVIAECDLEQAAGN